MAAQAATIIYKPTLGPLGPLELKKNLILNGSEAKIIFQPGENRVLSFLASLVFEPFKMGNLKNLG